MTGSHRQGGLLLIAALLLAACSGAESGADQETSAAPDAVPPTSGVTRSEVVAPVEPSVRPMPAQVAIQSQPGPDGSQVDLLKVAVTGDILTVTMRCSSEETVNNESFRINDISVIDDATSQRLGVLRDNSGNALVSDFNKASQPRYDYLGAECEQKPGIVWAKFPAPPPTTKTVSISFPEVGPFDGIPVTR
jgi:hypothetical protein